MNSYMNIIKEASIFMIVAEMIMHLVPSAEYEKYIRFLLDMICIMILFLPIVGGISNEKVGLYVQESRQQEEALEEQIAVWERQIGNLIMENYGEFSGEEHKTDSLTDNQADEPVDFRTEHGGGGD